MYRKAILALPLVLVACGTPAPPPGPGPTPPNPAQDGIDCGIALALSFAMNGAGSLLAAAQATPACMRLPADILNALIGNVTAKGMEARHAKMHHRAVLGWQ